MFSLLRQLSWPELRHHPWRSAAALVAVMLGVALAYSVHLINASALAEFGAAVRAVNGEADFSLVGPRRGFDEALYGAVANAAGVAVASPIVEADSVAFDAAGQRVPLRVVGSDAIVVARLAPALLPRPNAGSARFVALDPAVVFLNASAEKRLGGAGATTLSLQTASGRRDFRIAGSVAAGGPPLAVVDIAGAQVALDFVGRLSRIDVRLAPGADRATTIAALHLPRRRSRRRRRRGERARVEHLARLPRQPDRARAGGDVHRRLPGLLDPRPLGRAAPAAARAARGARLVGADSGWH